MTELSNYKVIIRSINQGVDFTKLEQGLIADFKAAPDKVKALLSKLQAGKNTLFQWNITHNEAEQICERLARLGLKCLIEQALSLEPLREECICPACGHVQPKAQHQHYDQCERCGIVHQNYAQYLARKQLIEAERYRLKERLHNAGDGRRQQARMKVERAREKAEQALLDAALKETRNQLKKQYGLTEFGYWRAKLTAALSITAARWLIASTVISLLLIGGYVLYSQGWSFRLKNSTSAMDQIAVSAPATISQGAAPEPTSSAPATISQGAALEPISSAPATTLQGATIKPTSAKKSDEIAGAREKQTPNSEDVLPPKIPASVTATLVANLTKVGQIEAAQQTLEKMLQFARNKPDQPQHKPDAVAFSQAELFGSLSEQQFQQGNTRAVAESLTKAGQFARSITDPAQRLKALSSTAVYAKLAGNSRLAKALFVEVLRAAEAFPTGLEQVEIRVGIAQDMAEAGDPAGAGAILNQVNQQIQQLSDPVERVGALAILARGWAEIKNIPLAEQVLAKAQTQLQALTDTTARPPALQFWQRPQAEAHGAMARNLLWQGQRDAGLKLFQQAQKEARAIADPLEQALALGTIARQLAQAGEPSQSRQVFAMALDIATGQEHSAKP